MTNHRRQLRGKFPQLGALMDRTIDAQPFLGQLVADPSARGLFAALSLLGMGVVKGEADLTPYLSTLEGFHRAMADALAERPRALVVVMARRVAQGTHRREALVTNAL